MSRKCELTGKTVQVGNNVSHAKNRTKRRFLPNLSNVTLNSDVLGRSFKFRIATSALRTVDAKGGLDPFLVKASDKVLSENALKIKKQIVSSKAAEWETLEYYRSKHIFLIKTMLTKKSISGWIYCHDWFEQN